MKRITVCTKIRDGQFKEIASIGFFGVRVLQPDGTTRVPLQSAGVPEERRVECLHATEEVSEDVVMTIFRELELGKGIGSIGNYHWRQE